VTFSFIRVERKIRDATRFVGAKWTPDATRFVGAKWTPDATRFVGAKWLARPCDSQFVHPGHRTTTHAAAVDSCRPPDRCSTSGFVRARKHPR
jgi:hypothetical protein